MDFNALSNQALAKLHGAVHEALREDDQSPKGKKVYGVREFPDWKQCADELEAAMHKKGMRFTPIPW